MAAEGGGEKKKKKQLDDVDRMIIEARIWRQTLLAKPNPRRFQAYPNPKFFYKKGKKIPQAALVYRPSERILLLAKTPARMYTPKYVPPEIPAHSVHPEALKFVATERILELARRHVETKEQPEVMTKEEKIKLRRARRFQQHRPAWLASRAAPKKIHQPKPIKAKKTESTMTADEREDRRLLLSRPKYIYHPEEPIPMVTKAAMRYVASKRILEISAPKELNPETVLNINFNPFKVRRGALRYKATEKIIALATPNVRKKLEDTDVKENPFSVLPRALTAICTRRVKELAKPIERD